MAEQKCIRCLLRELYPADYQKYVASLLVAIPPGQRAPEETYESRLEACKACEQLRSGTCMGCGCLVELRAAYRGEKCPFRKW